MISNQIQISLFAKDFLLQQQAKGISHQNQYQFVCQQMKKAQQIYPKRIGIMNQNQLVLQYYNAGKDCFKKHLIPLDLTEESKNIVKQLYANSIHCIYLTKIPPSRIEDIISKIKESLSMKQTFSNNNQTNIPLKQEYKTAPTFFSNVEIVDNGSFVQSGANYQQDFQTFEQQIPKDNLKNQELQKNIVAQFQQTKEIKKKKIQQQVQIGDNVFQFLQENVKEKKKKKIKQGNKEESKEGNKDKKKKKTSKQKKKIVNKVENQKAIQEQFQFL